MSTGAFQLKPPASLKREAERLAKTGGVFLNQWITVAMMPNVTAVEFAAGVLAPTRRRCKGGGHDCVFGQRPGCPADARG